MPTMTQNATQTHPIIASCLLRLAAVCDGASSDDAVGFNKPDSSRCRRIARALEAGYELSHEQHWDVWERLHKYAHTQLQVEIPSKEELAAYLASYADPGDNTEKYRSDEAKLAYRIEVSQDANWLHIVSPYDTGVISSVKAIEGCRWSAPREKCWNVPWHQYATVASVFDYFVFPQNWNDLVTQWEQREKPAPEPDGTIAVVNGMIAVGWQPQHERFADFKTEASKIRLKHGGRWDGDNTKKWLFPLAAGSDVLAAYKTFSATAEVKTAIDEYQREQEEQQLLAIAELENLIKAAGLEEPFVKDGQEFKLRQHQVEGVTEIIKQIETTDLRGVIMADDMGLGKTVQCLAIARAYQRTYGTKILIVCPAKLKDNWLAEAEMMQTQVEIFSWAKQPKPLELQEYVLIGDESHFIQAGKKSARGKSFLELALHHNCRAVIPATGTPMKNGRPHNIKPLLQAIGHELVKNSVEFDRYFCNARPTAFTRWDVTGAAHLDELSQRLATCGMIRRTKKECLDLPPKDRQFLPVSPEGDRLATYRAEVKRIMEEYEAARESMEPAAAIVMLTNLITAGAMAKIDEAVEWAEELLEQGNPCVLYSVRRKPLEEIYQILTQKGYKVEFLHGESKDIKAMVDRFQSGQSQVFLYTQAGGQGITLTAAQYGYMLSRPWTPGDAEQAEDRLHRIGQTGSVTWYWGQLGTIDQKIDNIIAEKQARIDKVLAGQRKTMRGVNKSINDMAQLLLDEFFKSEGKELAKGVK